MDEQTCLDQLGSGTEFRQRPAWEAQIHGALLWHACRAAVAARDPSRLIPWHQGLDAAQAFIAVAFGEHHVEVARAYLHSAAVALAAAEGLDAAPVSMQALLPLWHTAADIVGLPCACARDHDWLRTALDVHQGVGKTVGQAGTPAAQEHTLAPSEAVDLVFTALASTPYARPCLPRSRAWAWDVTRTLLGTPRRVVFSCEVTVAGTTADQGVLPTLSLEVLEPGSGEVFHAPEDAFRTYADADFCLAMHEAWAGALALAPPQAKGHWDGRWRLRQERARGSPLVDVANGRSASGAAARGWWHALTHTVPDDGVIVIAQVDPSSAEGSLRLTGVDDRGVFVKTQAIAQAPWLDTIVVASVEDAEAAERALGPAAHITVINLADT